MTKTEAIECLEKNIKLHEKFNETKHQSKAIEALNMAIDALAKEPKDDCISREWVMNLCKEWEPILATSVYDFVCALKCAPSVVPTTEQSSLVDIVRCKDCMLNTINTDGATEPWCYKFGYAVEDTDFCSYGERKEE